MNAHEWYIGCSGFYYKEWKERFYPAGLSQKDWFTFYCQHFNTLEINNTFYRFPEIKTLQGWFNKAPEHFVFSVKVPQTITHHKKFTGTEELMNAFYEIAINGLQHKLGPILFQMPPQFHFSEWRLNAILQQLDPMFINVIEFRHASWWREDVIELLRQNQITFCGVSYPGLNHEVIINTTVCYYRFHGVPKLYYSSYDPDFLAAIVQKIFSVPEPLKAFLYFNNTASAAAIDNAAFVQEIVVKHKT